MDHHDESFKDKEIVLDGNKYTGCTFDSCRLVITCERPFQLRGGAVRNCVYEFRGAALCTLHQLQLMYQTGQQELVEQMFDRIRKGLMGPPGIPAKKPRKKPGQG